MFRFNTSNKHTTNCKTDKGLKEEGNRLFLHKEYEKAIECYDQAIIKNPVVPIYFTNRALCFLKLKQWDKACTDCRRALEMDFSFIKGHYFLGLALIELESYDEAIKELQKAHDLAIEKNLNFGDDITHPLMKARKLKLEKQEEVRPNQEIELLSYLTKLMDDDMARKINDIKMPSDNQNEIEEYANCVMEAKNQNEKYTNELHNIFAENDDRRKV